MSDIIAWVLVLVLALWMLVSQWRINVLKKLLNQMTGYLAAIVNNDNMISESLTTVALHYGMDTEDLIGMLERKKNESKQH